MLNSATLCTALMFSAAAGCGTQERIEPGMATSPASWATQAHDCDLRVAVQPGASSLLVAYEFRNRSSRTAFLFNVLHRTGASGGPESSPDLVYIYPAGPAIVLAKKIYPVPADTEVERPDVPWVTRVDPGQVFREKFNVPLPLKLWTPYRLRGVTPPPEAIAWFELGFFLAPDPSVAKEADGHLSVYPFDAGKQNILRVGPIGRFSVAPAER